MPYPNYLDSITDWKSLVFHLNAINCNRCPTKKRHSYNDCETCAIALKIHELSEEEKTV